MSDDFRRWAADAAAGCRGRGLGVPEEDALHSMYDDGMEPEDAADPSIRKRYERRVPLKRFSASVGDASAPARKD